MVLADASECSAISAGSNITNTATHSHRYKDNQGTLFYNPATLNTQPVYAAAYMIQSSPSMICPYFNDTISYRSSTGLAYYVVCGGQYNNGIDITGGGSTTSKLLELACHQGRLYLAKHVNPSQVLRRASLCGELMNSVKPIRSFLTILSQRTKHSELYWSCMVLPQWV